MIAFFVKIAAGEIPSNKVYEDEICYAFYDIAPRLPPILVIPRRISAPCPKSAGRNSAVVAQYL